MNEAADDRQAHLHHRINADSGSVEAVKQTTRRMVLRHQPQLHPQSDIYTHKQHIAQTWTILMIVSE